MLSYASGLEKLQKVSLLLSRQALQAFEHLFFLIKVDGELDINHVVPRLTLQKTRV